MRARLEDWPLPLSLTSTKDCEKATPYAMLSLQPDHWKPLKMHKHVQEVVITVMTELAL